MRDPLRACFHWDWNPSKRHQDDFPLAGPIQCSFYVRDRRKELLVLFHCESSPVKA